MKAKRRTEITFETHETTIIRFRQSQTTIFCEACQAFAPHFSIVQAGSILSLSEPAISRLVDDNQIHARQTADGLILMCGNSLAALVKK